MSSGTLNTISFQLFIEVRIYSQPKRMCSTGALPWKVVRHFFEILRHWRGRTINLKLCITIVETTNNSGRGTNPVPMNHQSSERILAGQGIKPATSAVLKSAMLSYGTDSFGKTLQSPVLVPVKPMKTWIMCAFAMIWLKWCRKQSKTSFMNKLIHPKDISNA